MKITGDLDGVKVLITDEEQNYIYLRFAADTWKRLEDDVMKNVSDSTKMESLYWDYKREQESVVKD